MVEFKFSGANPTIRGARVPMGRATVSMVRRSICRMASQGKTARQTLANLRRIAKVLSQQDLIVPSLCTIERVRARFAKTGSAAPRVRRWRTRDWTSQEIGLAQEFVDRVHPSGWRLHELRRHLCEHSDRVLDRPLCAISRLVRKVLRCTPKLATTVAAQQDPVKVAAYWQDLVDSGITPEQLVFLDESGLTEDDLHVKGGWAAPGAPVRVNRPLRGRGMRTECISAICTEGLIMTRFLGGGTVKWQNFRRVITHHLLPHMNPWPLERSVLVRAPSTLAAP